MPKNIVLAASLPAPAERLFHMYLDSEVHQAITGAPVTIGPRAGSPFRAFDGMLSGTMLHIVPGHLIVQSWRSANWARDVVDSILMLSFVPQAEGGRIELVHVNVPDDDFAGVSHGWEKYYWTPWRAHLEANSRK